MYAWTESCAAVSQALVGDLVFLQQSKMGKAAVGCLTVPPPAIQPCCDFCSPLCLPALHMQVIRAEMSKTADGYSTRWRINGGCVCGGGGEVGRTGSGCGWVCWNGQQMVVLEGRGRESLHKLVLPSLIVLTHICSPVTGVTKNKRDVVELVRGMNIQFDNLCQVRGRGEGGEAEGCRWGVGVWSGCGYGGC